MEKLERLHFVMPFRSRRPAGGFRIMYEYANRFCELGYSVHISYPLKIPYMKYRLPYWIRFVLSYIEGFSTNKWFTFNPKITMSYIPSIKEKYMIDADIMIVTWWATVLETAKLSKTKGKKINLIQGYENWEGHIDLLHASYNLSDTVNVVVGPHLLNKVKEYTHNRTILIENSIDTKYLYLANPIENREATTICMQYSTQEIKGSKYGLEALYLIKEKCPKLKVDLFGVCPKPENLPKWIIYHKDCNNLQEIYNRNAISISNSLTEGFALVSVESMQCGCALICTDIEGHRAYAFDEKTAMLVKIKDPEMIAEKALDLINNSHKRIHIATNGHEYVQRYSWEFAMKKMNNLIKELLEEGKL